MQNQVKGGHIRRLLHYIRILDDINVQACACDSLYRITQFSFLLFYSDGLFTTVKLSAVLFI